MAHALLKFDLTDPDDRMEHLRAIKSTDMALVLWEICYNMKKNYERQLDSDKEATNREYELIQKIWEHIWEEMEDHGIKIDDLIC